LGRSFIESVLEGGAIGAQCEAAHAAVAAVPTRRCLPSAIQPADPQLIDVKRFLAPFQG